MEENNKIQYISWQVPEYNKKEREKRCELSSEAGHRALHKVVGHSKDFHFDKASAMKQVTCQGSP
jgi:hypothetical protein